MRASSIFTLAGFAATAMAQATSIDQSYVQSVLATAFPSSVIQQIATDPDAVFSSISSEFAAGKTPSWYAALPTDVKSYLMSQAGDSSVTTDAGNASPSSNPATNLASNTQSVTVTSNTKTSASTTTTSTGTGSNTAAQVTGSSTTTKPNGAGPMTVGAGVLGAAGLLGLLAL